MTDLELVDLKEVELVTETRRVVVHFFDPEIAADYARAMRTLGVVTMRDVAGVRIGDEARVLGEFAADAGPELVGEDGDRFKSFWNDQRS